jgi:hypothetical protein
MPSITFTNTETIFTQTSPISDDCLSKDCGCKPKNEGIFASISNTAKSLGRTSNSFLEYIVKRPTTSDFDNYTPENVSSFFKYEYLNDKKMLVGCSVSAYKRIENVDYIGDCEDIAGSNRDRRDASIKGNSQLKLARSPFEMANLYIIDYQIQKYYNKPCPLSGYTVGQRFDFGTCFYLEPDNINGLAFRMDLYLTTKYWHATNTTLVNATNDAIYSGLTNTDLIVTTYGAENNAAKTAKDYTYTTPEGVTYDDYYLPSKVEIELIGSNFRNLGIVLYPNETLDNYIYWTSTEYDSSQAWAYNLVTNEFFLSNKSNLYKVMLIKQF